MDLQFPQGIHPDAKDLITKVVVKDPDARLGCCDINEIRRHPYFASVEHKHIHLRSAPVLSLADRCLRRIGRNIKAFHEEIDASEVVPNLSQPLRDVLDRMRLVQKWLDDASPPQEGT